MTRFDRGYSKMFLGFFFFIICVKSSASVFDVQLWSTFLKSYISAKRFDAINILLSEESDLSLKDRKYLWNSLEVPFMAAAIDDSKKIDAKMFGRNSIAVAFAKTNKNLQLLIKASEQNLVRHYAWIVIGNPVDVARSKKAPYLALDNLVVFAEDSSSNQTFEIILRDTYQASPYLPYKTRQIGSWDIKRGLNIWLQNVDAIRTNLTGLHFRCTTLPQPPFIYISDGSPGEEVQLLKGYIKEVWDSLQDTFKFSYTCHTPSDNEWGSFRNGKWTGLVKEIKERTADVIVAPVDFTGQRSTAIQYLIGIRTVGYNLIIQRPGLMSSTWTSFTSELNLGSWFTTIFMLLFAPLCLMMVTKYSPYEEWKVPYHDAWILSLGALSIQGSWINVSSLSSRMVFITIFLSNLLIYAHYTSALVAQLTVTSEVPSLFSTLDGFLKSRRYSLGFKKGIALEDDFRHSSVYPYTEIWKRLIQPEVDYLPITDEDGVTRVINDDNFVYMMEENLFKFGFQTRCEVLLLPKSYFTATTSIAMSLNSPYAKAFNIHLTKLRVSGALDRFWKNGQLTGSGCTAAAFVALSIEQTFTAFLVLLLGVILSIFVCLPAEKYFEFTGGRMLSKVTDIRRKETLDSKMDSFNYPMKEYNEKENFKSRLNSFFDGQKGFR